MGHPLFIQFRKDYGLNLKKKKKKTNYGVWGDDDLESNYDSEEDDSNSKEETEG